METKIINVTKEKNWDGNEYLLYSDSESGKNIAELDYPNKLKKLPRVYCLANPDMLENDYVSFSSVTQALVGAETVVNGYFLDRGYSFTKFNYPKTIKMR